MLPCRSSFFLVWGAILYFSVAVGEEIDFAHQIVPILRQHCMNCHTGGEAQGRLSLNTRAELLQGGWSGPAVVPGDSEASELIARVTSEFEVLRMPPEQPALSEEEIELLRRWIDSGAAWEPGFSFHPTAYEPPLLPRVPELPATVGGREHPVDRLVDHYLAEQGLGPFEPIDDAAFFRRLSLDLIGQLPPPERLVRFVDDQDSQKRERLIDDLLGEREAYAAHWMSFWNDLLRNDYTGTGFITGGRKQITGWLYRSLVENKPYDQMVRELVNPSPESEGFIRGIRWRGDISASQTPEVQFAQNVSQVFLGINMKCASCHNSFVDRWTLDETYSLAAVFATSPLELHRCETPLGRQAEPAWLFPELGEIQADAPQPERLQQLADLMTHPDNGRLTRTIVNRLWHRLMGRGIVHPVDAMETPPWSADLLDFLAVHLAAEGYDLQATLRLIASSRAYQSRADTAAGAADAGDYVFRGPLARRLTAEQFLDAVWQLTGAGPERPDVPLPRAERAEPGPPAKLPVRASLMKNNALMTALGRPTRDQIVSMRPKELTTLEAIHLSNGQELADAISAGARQLIERAGAAAPRHPSGGEETDASDQLIRWLFTGALSRPPTEPELALARELLGETPQPEPLEDLLWSVFMLPEFQLVQ